MGTKPSRSGHSPTYPAHWNNAMHLASQTSRMKISEFAGAAKLESIPNVGPVIAAKLRLLGFASPSELAGQDPCEMYRNLCEQTG
ncbi:MAG: helix-hairpin-helix domain-containing protein, partial [Pirellulales bacterium]|nr:helix-hairpin-helix domain-containing protein [Pirellulales bacterium]